MGRIILPDELSAASQSIQSASSSYFQKLEETLPAITSFAVREDLQGHAWAGIKAQLSNYQSIIQGVLSALDSIHTDCESLTNLCGKEPLIEDDIIRQINQLHSLIRTYQEGIDSLQSTARKNPLLDLCLGSSLQHMIGLYQGGIENTFALIDALDKKLQKIYEIDTTTASLFRELALNLSYVKTGLACVRTAWTGSGFTLDANSAWKQELDKRYWAMHNKKILEKYFDLDEDGNIVGIKSEMAEKVLELLARLGHFIFEEDAGAFASELSDEERYVLAYLTIRYGPEVFSLYYGATRDAMEASSAAGFSLQDLLDELSKKIDGEDIFLLSDLLSFTFKDGKFTSLDKPTSFQARGGFSDYFDFVTHFLGMDIDTTITVFTYGDREYRLQVWDGLYMGGSTIGGEFALYARPLSDAQTNPYIKKDLSDYAQRIETLSPSEVNNLFINHRSLANEEDQLPMLLRVLDTDGNELLKNDTRDYANEGTHYWNYAVIENVDMNYTKEDTHVMGEITIEDSGLLHAMYEALQKDGITARILTDDQTLEIIWE